MKYLTVLFALAATLCQAQLANQPPSANWLVGKDNKATFSKIFTHHGKLLRGILLGACEGKADLRVNDQAAGSFEGKDHAASLDVTRFIHEGDNKLTITGSARVALLLELHGDMANHQWIASDNSWGAPTEAIKEQESLFDLKKAFDAYNSWQLAKPGAQSNATDADTLTVPDGFKAELIRSSQPGEDSWVAMTFDPQGRVTLAKEKRGLLRLDPGTKAVEVIDDKLLECRGLLYAHGALYANANNSKGLFRLRDTNGDGRFDESTELLHTEGGVGHGRNHIKLGPDGDIYIAHGNNVLLPTNVASTSPLQNYKNDQLLPNPWDNSMFDGNVELPAGHILRMKPDGSNVQLLAGGLRNPLDIAFNHDGEPFTFDADMERDVGAAWYMPTRVLHLVPGADYGWRRGTGRYPSYFIDTLPSVIDIGLSSPTGVFFGYGAHFPYLYEEALYILDWSYGRIIAVHMSEKGASYTATQETFVSGRPLNVTDGCIGPDGALWFITGGRGTQSGLYRVSYTKPISDQEPQRKPRTVPAPSLASDEPFSRHAAIMDLEQHLDRLTPDLLKTQTTGWQALTQWYVAVRSGRADLRAAALEASLSFNWDESMLDQKLALLRVIQLGLIRGSEAPPTLLRWLYAKWAEPNLHTLTRRELTKLLVFLKSPSIIARATDYLKTATSSEDLLFYPMHLRYLSDYWTVEQLRIAFDALNRAEKLNGASSFFKAIADTRAELTASLPPKLAMDLADVISPPKPAQLSMHALPSHSFKQYKLADLEPQLAKVSSGRSYESAKAALVTVQCVFCHRVSADNTLPAGLVGPDLTQVSARFGRRDLLMHILEPSAVIDEKFRTTIITKTDGATVVGSLEREDDERVVLKPNPLVKDEVEVGKSQIKSRELSTISPMPPGLLNSLKPEQVLDILAWFEASGDPKHKVWQTAK